MPDDIEVEFLQNADEELGPFGSKAVGEPPLMLGLSVWCALRDAASSYAGYQMNPPLDAPATPEQVYRAIQAAKSFEAGS